MARRRSAGVSRVLAGTGIRRKSPPGYSGGYGGGPAFIDAFRSRRAPTLPELVEAFKSVCYACATLNAGGVVRTPLRLYTATKSGQARPKCAVRGLTKSYADRERLRWMTRAAGYSQYTHTADEIDEVMEHPILDVLKRPNPDFSHHGLIRFSVLSGDMIGSFYWQPETNGELTTVGVPDSFWPLLAQYVYPVRVAGRSQVERYTYFGQSYDPTAIVRCRIISLRDPYGFGYGPAQAAFEWVGLGDQFVSVQENMMAQGFRPSAVISPKDGTMPMGKDERRRLEQDINSKWRGAAAGRVWVSDGALDVKPLNFPPADLAALQISDNAMQRVANCFGVPLSLLKTEDVNLANAEAGHRQHAELGIQPRCVDIASAITHWIHNHGETNRKAYARDPGWDRLFVAFDNPVVEDEERRAKIDHQELADGTLLINEVRNRKGRDNVKWGNLPAFPGTIVPYTGEKSEPQEPTAPDGGPGGGADPEEVDETEDEDGTPFEDDSAADKSWRGKGERWSESDHRRDENGQFTSTGGGDKPAPAKPSPSRFSAPTEVGKPVVANPDKVSGAPLNLARTPTIAWARPWFDAPDKNMPLAAKAAEVRGIPKDRINTDKDNYKIFDEATGNMFLTMMVPAGYEVNSDKLYFNRSAMFWVDPAKKDKQAAENGWSSAGNPEHAVDHEIGHYLHAHAIGKEAFIGLHHKALPPAEKPYVEKTVGTYASSSVNDFVAEVYSGRKAGKDYPPRINKLYRQYGGPEEK